MHDARPVLLMLLLDLFAVVLLLGWWASVAPEPRLRRLVSIALQEDARSAPPRPLDAQAEWLLWHRTARAQGVGALLAVLLLLAAIEGSLTRAHDPYAGFRLQLWVLGLLGLALVPGLGGVYVFWPWPVPLWQLVVVIIVCPGGALYLAMRGRPYVP